MVLQISETNFQTIIQQVQTQFQQNPKPFSTNILPFSKDRKKL